MAWARAFISDQKQDKPPNFANEILTYGDVIFVEKNHDEGYRLSQLPQASAAIVSLSPDDGAIKAAVGGFSFKQSQFNRVTQAKRQVGSNIKPFVYSAALEHGFTLASLVNDAPINQWDKSTGVVWRPKNSPEKYDGPIRVRLALAQSKNVVAVRLLKSVGIDNIINHLSSFGFSPDELPRNESLALGSASLTPLNMARGFASFANGGFLIEPYLIERIENGEGEIVYQADPVQACDPCFSEREVVPPNNDISALFEEASETTPIEDEVILAAPRAISEQNAFLITEALTSAIWDADWSGSNGWQGTGWRARALKRRDIAGKTGTTNEAKDAWFSGFSRRLVTTSWIGFDDPSRNLGKSVYNNNLSDNKNQITGKEFGARSAQPAWIEFMKIALADLAVESFQPPVEIVSVRIDKATGKLTTKIDKTSRFEYFRLGRVPSEYLNKDDSGDIFTEYEEEKVSVELF
jgi:penicillin-binding protein 1A